MASVEAQARRERPRRAYASTLATESSKATTHARLFSLQPFADRFDTRLQHGHAAEVLVLRRHNVPGSKRHAGPGDHFIDGGFVLRSLVAVAPVFLRDLVVLVR